METVGPTITAHYQINVVVGMSTASMKARVLIATVPCLVDGAGQHAVVRPNVTVLLGFRIVLTVYRSSATPRLQVYHRLPIQQRLSMPKEQPRMSTRNLLNL
jgi:hypothetical protein